MTFDIVTHVLSGADWPKVLNVMRGDVIRATGASDSNGVTMTMAITGGKGRRSSSDRNWVVQWDTRDARSAHTVTLLSKTGQNEEVQLAETKLIVHDAPPLKFEKHNDSTLFINTYQVVSDLTSRPKSVEWIVDGMSRGVESIVDGKAPFALNQLLPGTHQVVGRVKFQENQGSAEFASFNVDIGNTLEAKVEPDDQIIDLTARQELKSIVVSVKPLVVLPGKARIVLTINGMEQELSRDIPQLVFETNKLGAKTFTVGASIVDNGMRRESYPLKFAVKRDFILEAARIFIKIQAVPTKRIERYIDNTKDERDVSKMLALSTAVLQDVELAISVCNSISLPEYLLREHQVLLLGYQAVIRDTLAYSRRFLISELQWWHLLSVSSGEIQGQVKVLLAARQVPVHPYDILQRNLNMFYSTETKDRNSIRETLHML